MMEYDDYYHDERKTPSFSYGDISDKSRCVKGLANE
jgi:hypothetical protein